MNRTALLPPAHLLTAEGWALYTESMDCTEAARQLTDVLVRALASCSCADEVQDLVDPVRVAWADFGATDSEPRNLVRAYIDATFAPLGERHYEISAAAGIPPYV